MGVNLPPGMESGALPANRLRDLPPGMDGFYADTFERRFPSDDAYEAVRPILGVLCPVREPVARADLAASSVSRSQPFSARSRASKTSWLVGPKVEYPHCLAYRLPTSSPPRRPRCKVATTSE